MADLFCRLQPTCDTYWSWALYLTGVCVLSGCATMAKVTNLSEESCRTSFMGQLSAILTAQGEKPVASDALAHATVSSLTTYDIGSRAFAIAAPSGTGYRLFIDHKDGDCVLTLFGQQRGFVSYTNNMTYISTKSLPHCSCTE